MTAIVQKSFIPTNDPLKQPNVDKPSVRSYSFKVINSSFVRSYSLKVINSSVLMLNHLSRMFF